MAKFLIFKFKLAQAQAITDRKRRELIKKISGIEQNIIYEPERLGDLRYFVCDITKAKQLLRWEPRVSNEEGLSSLINWVKENKELFV